MTKKWIDTLFRDQYGIDIETVSFSEGPNQIAQIGIKRPGGSLYEINVQQPAGFKFGYFHQQEGRLGPYFKREGIDLSKTRAFESALDEEGRRFYRAVLAKERAQNLVKKIISTPSNRPANFIIHNANFEIRHFNSWFEGQSPFSFSKEYKNITIDNRKNRALDALKFEAGTLTGAEVRQRDITRQLNVYAQIIEDAKKGGNIIDTMELAKTLNALGQKRGILPGAELTVGTNVEFLAKVFLGKEELHRAAQDVALQNALAPKLVQYIEDLKNDRFSVSKLPKNHPLKKWAHIWQEDALSLKVGSQTKAIEQAIENLSSKGYHKYASGRFTARSYEDFVDFLGRTGKYKSDFTTQGMRIADYGVDASKIVSLAEKNLSPYHKTLLGQIGGRSKLTNLFSGRAKNIAMYGAGALGLGVLAYNAISSNDDDYNTIEGLRHGWFGSSRKYFTDFGSGYKGPREYEDPTPARYGLMGLTAVGAAGLYATWNRPFLFPFSVNKLNYTGQPPRGMSKTDFLGRERATVGDILYNAIRRIEVSAAGIPKAFSISTLLSPSYLRDAAFSLDITRKETRAYSEYLNQLLGQDLTKDFRKVSFRGSKLYGTTYEGSEKLLLKEARLYQRIHDPNISKSVSQFAKSYENIILSTSRTGYKGLGREYDFLIAGGKSKTQATMRAVHAYAHETLSKYLRLVDDPIKATREVFDIHPRITQPLEKITKMLPKFGVGGERYLAGTVPQLLSRHAKKALPLLLGIPFATGMADWLIRKVSPEGTVAEEAGLTGLVGEAVKTAHLTYAKLSDITSLTDIRKVQEEKMEGSTGLLPFLGTTLVGSTTGLLMGSARNLLKEVTSKNPYETMLANKLGKKPMRSIFKYLPTLRGEYVRSFRYTKMGAAAGVLLGLPFLISGLGSSKSFEELSAEYSGEKEVPVRKGRWWEFGQTPWSGDKIMYYRENWYARMRSKAKEEQLYGENISPIEKAVKTFLDPYWVEEKHYRSRPYPITGPGGEELGLFGPLWARTIGRIIKPPAYMHMGEWDPEHAPEDKDYAPVKEIGGIERRAPINPYGLEQMVKDQWRTTYEAVGLRGFVASAIKQLVTGEQEIDEYTPILQSAQDIDSTRRDYWDLNLGGLVGLTEPYRRFNPKRPYVFDYVNEIKNQMPEWMPGEDYYIDFTKGDPYTKVPEGEYRLPGEGYAARFEELEGVDPADYPLIHRYKILADVAMYSKEYKSAKAALRKSDLTDYERNIFEVTEQQVEEKRVRKRFWKESSDIEAEQSLYKGYAKTVFDVARSSPFEQLLPFSPAHKFLPGGSALQQYEESIYGKDFKLWQRPIDDFIKPFISSSAWAAGIRSVPSDVEEARTIEEYFDELKYVKFRRLERQATAAGDEDNAKLYRSQWGRTVLGADPYGHISRITGSIPKREREYFKAFTESEPEGKEEILEIAPKNLRSLYIAQWDKAILKDIEEGKLVGSDQEQKEIKEEIFNRMKQIRSSRSRIRQQISQSSKLPPDDWIGWRPNVDLEDIKLKYLISTARDYHYYDLWDDRLRALGRKPYLDEALGDISPLEELEETQSYENAYRIARNAGIDNPEILMTPNTVMENNVDLEYTNDKELKEYLRELGQIA